ncbi:hypothetical protein HYPSUDRAFT_44329 [Hypholoma sublateritium FD-334 SS-4]|uniref:BCS1 N-terminal domain-containing protein n=1 Tax=Hypholoma sublateritium (strain FD-334 SS-4) TaxID=945553 RepID=A0A0D2M815_HYPSF|nr:hypothetical protein HYPSUDRAFT_44329 [Hypholoma sublateritium FD-334 SS-4]
MATPLVLAQQVFSALNGNLQAGGATCSNATGFNETHARSGSESTAFPADFSSLVAFLLSASALSNWLKLALFGSFLETCRRLVFHLYYKVYSSIFVTACFDEDDSSYDWIMVWLSTPSWKTARDVQVSTRPFGLNSTAVMIKGEEEDSTTVMNRNRQLAYLPSTSSSLSFWYRRHWIQVCRNSKEGYYGLREDVLEICIMSIDHPAHAQEHMISVYVSDTSNNWWHIASCPKRPLNSIVLDPGIKDLLIDDAREFLERKSCYAARGIPFRRGYLLYNAPGSGKTGIIHSLAGELGLDVNVISLSRLGLDDTALGEIISELPEKCIDLMEDVDAAFSQTLNRDLDEEEKNPDQPQKEGNQKKQSHNPQREGRIIFSTTNKYSSLDPALCRPGRMDIHIEFKLASRYQARELYSCFYLPDSDLGEKGNVTETGSNTEGENDDSGYSSANEKLPPSPSEASTNDSPIEPVIFSGSSHCARPPKLSHRKIVSLADTFASSIPEREFSMAALQGYLMAYKVRPFDAVKDVVAWVEKERAE